ncbi:MAG: hypothetical protein AAF502_05410 [Bacteroidota bacterium]
MNKLKAFILVLFISAMAAPESASAREIVGEVVGPPTPPPTTTSRNDCNPSTSQVDLDINNVRARLLGGGDQWWDLADGRYVIPNVPLGETEVSSIFAASVWVGGFDDGGNLKIAAQTYRQSGNDFWPGPLDENGETEQATCNNWDRHFEVLGSNIDRLTADYLSDDDGDGNPDFTITDEVAEDLLRWPAKGNPHFASRVGFSLPNQELAPFFDADGDGLYDPQKGDFPIIGITDCDISDVGDATYGDQMIFWIYNDKGNIHTETGGDRIGMEVHALAFGFATDDEINNMSFYKYKLFNKATEALNDSYIAMWVDPDLGCWSNDYVGCNIEEIDGKPRNLGIVYNGEAVDNDCSGVPGYGSEVPMLGVDYFRGPRDESGTELGMSAFIYYNNDFSTNGNPEVAIDFYGYMAGFWKDGSPIEFGGDGFQEGTFETNFMFPSDPSSPNGPGVWSECSENNDPADRRFVQSSGPFRLDPGATNEVIIGAVWVPRGEYPCPTFTPLLAADDVAQKLFDNCFDLVDGPDAPEIEIVEMDQELVLSLVNLAGNNIGENYMEQDPFISPALTDDLFYEFEGYVLYQLASAEVSPSEYDDPEQAREVAIVDIKNGVSTIVNYEQFPDPEFFDGKVPVVQIESPDNGIVHSFNITNDLFATGDSRLVNHTKYYYSVVAYAYNNWLQFDPFTEDGQERQYLPGRRNIKVFTAIPHINDPEVGGTIVNAKYGDSPEITRFDGVGNSGLFMEVADGVADAILAESDNVLDEITYKAGAGPFSVKVVNPLNVVDGSYDLAILDNNLADEELQDSIFWRLSNGSTTWYADRTIDRQDERLIPELGISVTMQQVVDPGIETMIDNGFIGATSEQLDGGDAWYGGLPDGPGGSIFNFIRTDAQEEDEIRDPLQIYSGVLGGSWYPYALTSWKLDPAAGDVVTPAWTNNFSGQVDLRNKLEDLISVDIVLTSDKSKWSRCPVINTFSRAYNSEGLIPINGDAGIYKVRTAESVGQDGLPDGTGTGMGWFPGYAYNVETGERLNVFFGENALYDQAFSDATNIPVSNGNDMIWNPTSDAITPVQNPPFITSFAEVPVGGQHTIYVTNTVYDEGAELATNLASPSPVLQIGAWSSVIWTSIPLLPEGTTLNSVDQGIVPSDVIFRLRVNSPFEWQEGVLENEETGYPKYEFAMEGFNTVTNDVATAESALDIIQVVPNPYYAFSSYESTQFENIVKITNLPNEAVITIFSLDGRLIRRYNRNEVVPSGPIYDQVVTSLEWDLRNQQGIPVASGVYLIHIDAGTLGERVIKWFGTMRKFDTLGL